MINSPNYHYFHDGGNIVPHAEIAAAPDDDHRQLLHQQKYQQHGFTINNSINLNNSVDMNTNNEDVGGIEIDDGNNHDILLHHDCMIDMEDHVHESHGIGCQGSENMIINAYNNHHDNETNINLASIDANDHTEINYNGNSSINENNGENHDQVDDDENCWQVVPDSLDHLSRDELCRIIYRLDYERNALLLLREQHQQQPQQQLQEQPQQQQFMPASTAYHNDDLLRQVLDLCNNYNPGHGNEDIIDCNGANRSRKKQKRRKSKRAHDNANSDASNGSSLTVVQGTPRIATPFHNPPMAPTTALTNIEGEGQHHILDSLPRVSRNNEFDTSNDVNENITSTAVEDLRSCLCQSLLDTILSSAIHGGRRIPKSTIAMKGVSYQIARAIVIPPMNESGDINQIGNFNVTTDDSSNIDSGDSFVYDHITNIGDSFELSVVADTRRMIKWRITGEHYIANVLGRGEERLIHPVRHDGTGIYVISSSSASSSVSSTPSPNLTNDGGSDSSHNHHNQSTRKGMYHYAKFQCLDIKYDKWEKVLTIIAKTVAVDDEHGRDKDPPHPHAA